MELVVYEAPPPGRFPTRSGEPRMGTMMVRSYPFGVPRGLELDPMYAWLRENEPLSRVRLPYGDEAWLVVRHEDVRTVLGDPRFSRAATVERDAPRLYPDKVAGGLVDLDPPEHTRLRRLIAKAFTARRVEQLRTRAEQVATGLLDVMVLTVKHAANRDPRVYPDPDRLDLTREAKGHFAFGHGAHHCVGAQLARMGPTGGPGRPAAPLPGAAPRGR